MKELQNILARMRELESSGANAVLATVVDVQGSSYRLPGAKMLILETGEFFGTVSGGCLEADVLERAKQVLKTGKPQVIIYDTRTNDNSVFALNMGCNGIVRILLESARNNEYFDFVRKCFETRQEAIAATLIRTNSETDLEIGARFFVGENATRGKDFREELENLLLADSHTALKNRRSHCETYQRAAGTFEFFFELVKPPLLLIIFGAGADAVPLCDFAKNLGWRVEVLDHRPAFASKERFPQADFVSVIRPDEIQKFLTNKENYAAVVMTHNYVRDKELIWRLFNANARYIGALGPKRRTENILGELAAEGKSFPSENLEKLCAPVGLDIGADTPEAIAVSIVAEINAVLSNRNGGFLRYRKGSIYNRNETTAD
jgi:xanthine/CO dehydrogenase XdhC/CoxF family maturation factor